MQRMQLNFKPGTVIDLKVRVEDLPALMRALGSLSIAEGEVLHTMVKAQVSAASMMQNAATTKPSPAANAAPDQNTEAKTAESPVDPELPEE